MRYLALLFLSGCSVFGIRTVEEPSFKLERTIGDIEVRLYEKMVVVETVVDAPFREASNSGFRRLFKYISGENSAGKEFAMTAPVEMKQGWKMSFVLPEPPEQPLSKDVTIREIPERRVAVLRYSGFWEPESINEKGAKLIETLKSANIKFLEDSLRSAAYDPPWTIPFLRRNEVHVDLEE